MLYPFKVGEFYARRDVYRVIGISEETHGGHWDTGYAPYKGDWFIFCNVGVAGRTGHNYANQWVRNRLEWYGKTNSRLHHKSIQSMIGVDSNTYVFWRENNQEPFVFAGIGMMEQVEDSIPVKVIWSFETVSGENIDQTQEVTSIQGKLDRDGYFNPENIKDARERTHASIAKRKGQPKFRSELIAAYQSQCAITGFNAEQALEAAHIYPFKGDDTNKVWNGLLLRADIHTLFDLYLITIHPKTKEIIIAPELESTNYSELQGEKLRSPKDENKCPSEEALKWHYKQCKWT